jgi:hypothetical protein
MLGLSLALEVSLRTATLEGRLSRRVGLRPAHFTRSARPVLTARFLHVGTGSRFGGYVSSRRGVEELRAKVHDRIGQWQWLLDKLYEPCTSLLLRACFVWTFIYFLYTEQGQIKKVITFVNSGENVLYVFFRAMDYWEMNRIYSHRCNAILIYNRHRSVM